MNVGKVAGGAVLLAAGVGIFFWNQAATKKRAAGLASATKECVSVETVDPGNEGKLVHVTGAISGETLADKEFDISVKGALALTRKVETYQWKESSKSTGKGKKKKTTYSYETVWSEKAIDSNKFKGPDKAKHTNPKAGGFQSTTWKAQGATLGSFKLTPDQAAKLTKGAPLPVESLTWGVTFVDQTGKGEPQIAISCIECNKSTRKLRGLRDHTKAKHKNLSVLALNTPTGLEQYKLKHWKGKVGGKPATGIMVGENPGSPKVGDLRITFEAVKATEGTGVGMQKGDGLAVFKTKADTSVFDLRAGKATKDQMFASLKSSSEASGVLGSVLAGLIALGGLGLAGAGVVGGGSSEASGSEASPPEAEA